MFLIKNMSNANKGILIIGISLLIGVLFGFIFHNTIYYYYDSNNKKTLNIPKIGYDSIEKNNFHYFEKYCYFKYKYNSTAALLSGLITFAVLLILVSLTNPKKKPKKGIKPKPPRPQNFNKE